MIVAERWKPRQVYKVLTHDLRPPIQGGDPILPTGYTLPYRLPETEVDRSQEQCSRGWNACADAHTALRIAGLWPTGRPSRLFLMHEVKGCSPVYAGEKVRAASWDVVREVDVSDDILATLHAPMAGDGLPVEDLVAEVKAWRIALTRPQQQVDIVERSLATALSLRGLGTWKVKRFEDARDARATWVAWDARAAWATRDAWDAWATRAARASRASRDAWATWDAMAARDAWNAWATWDAMDARDALTVLVAGRRRWTEQNPLLLTTGLRDAYHHGMALAIPTGPSELGYAMVEAG